jgi:acyl dehydratase
MLRRGGGGEDAKRSRRKRPDFGAIETSATWKLPGDLGRRYAGVSGDRNPIHMHSLTAKPLGFPSAIAHGMWTKARALAQLGSKLPDSFEADVRFRKPVLLPARVEFASAEEGEEILFTVRDAKKGTPHLDGRVQPLSSPKPQTKSNSDAARGLAKSKTSKTGRKTK